MPQEQCSRSLWQNPLLFLACVRRSVGNANIEYVDIQCLVFSLERHRGVTGSNELGVIGSGVSYGDRHDGRRFVRTAKDRFLVKGAYYAV